MTRLIVVMTLLLAACGADLPQQAAIPSGASVLILGDSLSYGTGAESGQDYPSLLAQTTGWQIINAGVPGDTTSGGLTRLPDLIASHQPQLLIVELGGNDLLRQVAPSEIELNLKSILNMAKTQGIPTVLVSIPAISPLMAAVGNLSDHPLYARIAEETNTPLIADVFSEVLSERSLKADQIHPNAKGYAEVALNMQTSLKQLGYLPQ